MSEAEGALAGIRVLDLSILVQGPQSAQTLADMGADVIKVELPELGDQGRWIPISREDTRAPFWIGCNRGKRSLTLDVRPEAGRDAFLRLVDHADVVVANFVPGTLEGWELGYETLRARNPRIILAEGSTFGPEGPDAHRKGADIVGQAASGAIRRSDTGYPVGMVVGDHTASQNLTAGILAALYARERTGRGQHIQVSLLGSLIYAQAGEYTYSFLTGENPGENGYGHNCIPLVYGVVPTQDGALAVAGIKPGRLADFFALVGRPELAEDPRFQEGALTPEERKALFDELAKTFRTKTTEAWERILDADGQRFSRVRNCVEVSEDPGVHQNGYLQRVEHPEYGEIPMLGSPIRMSDTPTRPGQLPPELGQNTEEVLMEAGLSWDEIMALREAGTI